MDFHSLSRRELQAFCKKNKIPANMTNAAMADALKALEIVEGIEEFMQPSQTESAQSSIEGLESSEVSSPYVPPTAARSTRRRNVLKNDGEAPTSILTTTRRTTRKTAAKGSNESQVDSMETPAVAAQASRRKVQMASACLQMDSQLNECVEEEKKKDALTTPALASRRRRVEETEKKVYSTRRSVRLAVKNVQMVNDVKSEESQISKKNELFPKDGDDQEMNLKEGMDECDEMSEITGADAVENMESSEVVSEQKQDMTIGEMEMESTPEEVACTDFAVEVEQNEETCDNTESPADENITMPVNANDEVQQSEEGCLDICTSEIEATVENSKEVNIQIDEASDFSESKVDEVSRENEVEVGVEDYKEMDVEELNVTLDKLTELRLQPEELKQTETESDEMHETLEDEGSAKTAVEEPGVEETATASVEKHLSDVEGSEKTAIEEPRVEEQIPITDNKENMVSEGNKPASAKESVNLNELSMIKLTKMLKEKLQITNNKSSKHGNEATARTALQALPENQ